MPLGTRVSNVTSEQRASKASTEIPVLASRAEHVSSQGRVLRQHRAQNVTAYREAGLRHSCSFLHKRHSLKLPCAVLIYTHLDNANNPYNFPVSDLKPKEYEYFKITYHDHLPWKASLTSLGQPGSLVWQWGVSASVQVILKGNQNGTSNLRAVGTMRSPLCSVASDDPRHHWHFLGRVLVHTGSSGRTARTAASRGRSWTAGFASHATSSRWAL